MRHIRRKYEREFKIVFGVPLSQYWDDNHGGFQVKPFMTQVLEYEGPWVFSMTSEKFGIAGIKVVGKIMEELTDYWTLPF